MNELNKLQYFRKEKGLTQQELSTLSGILNDPPKMVHRSTDYKLTKE